MMWPFDYKCEYAPNCNGYQETSETCTKGLDKSYCGIWRSKTDQ